MEPITREENVVLKLKLSKFLTSDDGVDEVILSRYNNSINELANGKTICHYRLQQPIAVAQQLKVFYSYEPKFKHYIFMNGSELVILRKLKDALVLHKTYSNVTNFAIEDKLGLGKPQVVVHCSYEPPIVTDCNNENGPQKPERKLIQTFATLVQKSKLRIEHAEESLREKTKILSKLSSTLAFNCDDDGILTTVDRLVYLKESLAEGDVGLPAKDKALSCGDPWFRTHSEKWIIGFPVVNLSKGDLSAFEMYVSHESITIKKTVLFTRFEEAGASSSDVHQESPVLTKGNLGHLVAVMEEPHFIARSFVLKCVCCFETVSNSASEQCFLGQIEVTTLDLAGDKHRVSWQTVSSQDTIAIQASSKSFELSYELLNITRTQFIDAVESVFKCKKIKANVLLYSETSRHASNFLLFFEEYSNRIKAYTDTSNDFMLLLHKFLDVFRGSVLFKHPNSEPSRGLEAMKKEVSFVKKLLENELVESDSKPPVNLDDALRDMMLLEIDSAVEISLLKQYSLQ